MRYYATASFHLVSADFYGVNESTVCRIVPIVSDEIAALRERFISMLNTNEELEQKKLEFFRVGGIPSVIGAIDGTLVKIQEFGGCRTRLIFFVENTFMRSTFKLFATQMLSFKTLLCAGPDPYTMKLFS